MDSFHPNAFLSIGELQINFVSVHHWSDIQNSEWLDNSFFCIGVIVWEEVGEQGVLLVVIYLLLLVFVVVMYKLL